MRDLYSVSTMAYRFFHLLTHSLSLLNEVGNPYNIIWILSSWTAQTKWHFIQT